MKTLYELIDFGKNLILYRFKNVKGLEKEISSFLGFKINLHELDNGGLDFDFGVNLGLDNKDLYFDLYYLLDKYQQLVITEFRIDSDDNLTENDYDKIIKPLKESE